MANITVANIRQVSELPPEDQRDPQTLYITPHQIGPRDQALGWFMGVWSGLEQTLLSLTHVLIGGPYSRAGVVFANCGGIAQIIELMNGLGELVLTNPEMTRLASLTDRLRKQNTRRNRIVHGVWVPELVVGGDDKGRPVVKSLVWARIYSPTSPTEKAKIDNVRDAKTRSKYRFAIADIQEVGRTVETLRNDFNNFQASIEPRLQPRGPNLG